MTLALPAPPEINERPRITIEEIVSVARQRRSQDSILIRQMIEVRDRYNGDVVLPLPDVDKSPTLDIPIPRLIAMSVDANARRAASPKPTIICPALNPASKRSRKDADVRRKMMYAKWTESQLELKLYRFYRHLAAYGTACMVVMPDAEYEGACIELRDPLTAYPELRDPSDIRDPKNVCFIYGRSIDWITSHYPASQQFFSRAAQKNWDTLWDVIEWIDEWEVVIGIMGPRMPAYLPQDARPYGYGGWELARWTNKAGMVPVSVPRRVTLDRVMGQMSTMIDTVDLYARLTALNIEATERHVFPDLVIMSEANQQAQLVSGQWKDGRTAEANVVDNARGVQYLTTQFPAQIEMTLQNLENTIRQSGGASEIMSGDNAGMRTGRGLDVMGSFSIDPQIEEAQKTAAQVLSIINSACVAVEQGYFGGKTHTCFTGLQGDDAVLEYKPNELDSDLNIVKYPMPGTDVSQMSVAVAQMVGANLMSKHTGRVIHPLIDDADQEENSIWIESLEQATLQTIEQQAATGSIPPIDVAGILAKVRSGSPLEDAIVAQQKEAQARQATQAPPPQEGQTASPQAQPGLGPPGQGAEQPAIPPPTPGLQDYHQLARALVAPPSPTPTAGPPGGQ